MKKLLFFYLLIPYFLFAGIDDKLGIFSNEENQVLEKRITQLKDLYEVDFDIYTFNDNIYLENKLKNKRKTVIIGFYLTESKVVNVKMSLSDDLDFSGYTEEINTTLKDLSVLIEKEEYGDYTYELLANIGDIINIIQLENKEEKVNIVKKGKNVFIITFKVIISSTLILAVYLFVAYLLKSKNKTYCSECNKNMVIDQEIERENSIMKVYKCPICGKRKRVNTKRY